MAYFDISDFILDQVFGYQTATKVKNNITAVVSVRLEKSFGGSSEHSVNVNGLFDVIERRDVEYNSTQMGGLTVRARVEGKTANAATSVTPLIRNVTDSVDHVTGSAITSLTFVEQILTMSPLVAGTKKYRLRGNTNNANNDVWLFGVSETYA